MDFNINEIKEKIEILKEMDKEFEIFGSSKHKYKLHPCKTEKEIQRQLTLQDTESNDCGEHRTDDPQGIPARPCMWKE